MASLLRRDAPGAPNADPGPPYVILSDVTTLYGKRRVSVRLRGGRRFTVAMRSGEITDEGLTILLDTIAADWPEYPMRYTEETANG